MQCGQNVEVDLAKRRILSDGVVIVDLPDQVIGPEGGVICGGADRRIEHRIVVDRIAVDILEGGLEPGSRFVVQVCPLLVGEEQSADPFDPVLLRRRGQAKLLRKGVEVVGEGHR